MSRIEWPEPILTSTPQRVAAFTHNGSAQATASAEFLMLAATEYGVPPEVPQERVFRFSRVKAIPRGAGGGGLVLGVVLGEADRRGLWTVLEASPYPGQDEDALFAFYEKHGFRHDPKIMEPSVMFRPPGGKD